MKPVIFGCAGPALTDAERSFFAEANPAGFILFARNIQSPLQLKALTTDLRLAVDRAHVPILIDQEGGRVQRMGPPDWRALPPMGVFGDAFLKDRSLACRALELHCKLIADDLRRVGINVDCLPVVDVPVEGADTIIGDRAFGRDPVLVAELGGIVVETLRASGIMPVMKHMPGHGRAAVDSHLALPRVKAGLDALRASDFAPFGALADCPFAMTAHIIYEAIDAEVPATLSDTVIRDIIRGELGYQGLLMSDDLSMQALSGPIEDRAARALDAGCDLVLHCNGDMAEMAPVAASMTEADPAMAKRLDALLADANAAPHVDRPVLEAIYDATMAQVNELM